MMRNTSHVLIALAVVLGLSDLAAQGRAQGGGRGAAQGGEALAPGQRRGVEPSPDHPVLKIGAAAPDFTLPGIDGKTHTLAEYSKAKLLAIVFQSNHCPVSQLYEGRIKKIHDDYLTRGVQVVAINPNNPKAVRINELDHADMSDSLAEMKIRAAYRKFNWPYLYDGETQSTGHAFGAISTPHIFIFDENRKLRYQGRIDDNMLDTSATTNEARDAIDALLAGKPVAVETTRAFGCSTKWMAKSTDVQAEWARIVADPVKLDLAGASEIKALRANPTKKMLVINVWSTACKTCVDGFPDLQFSYWMYRIREYTHATISTDDPKNSAAVLTYLQSQHAGQQNLLATVDHAGLEAALGERWPADQPFVMMIQPDGQVVYRKAGKVDSLEFRRTVVRTMPDDRGFIGMVKYWNSQP